MNTHDSYQKGRKRRKRRTNRGSFLSVILMMAIMLAGCANLLTYLEEDTLPPDCVPPTIQGVKDISVYAGETVSYLSGITVTDDCDLNPSLTVDSSRVDLTAPGTYEIVYIASDSSGNVRRVTAVVTVMEKPESKPDAIDAAADKILAEIITDNMTVRQQLCAVYAWAKTSIGYGGHSDRTDWRQTAYVTLTERRGDCYGYFCVTKLMFERLGIPNIDVKKVRNFPEDSDHFWSLVSVDGGKTWYHFDATPRVGDGDNFCLVTDALLDDYSDSHKGSHNRDKSLYPATP
ncbi:MAG: transglutaminase domain-containing protein [Faecousia sp.]